MEKTAWDFNKEILFGEIGAVAGAFLVSYLTSQFTKVASTISTSAVIGAVAGASVFWLIMRQYDQKRNKTYSTKHLANDIAYFTPVAVLLTLAVYYPALFLISQYLLTHNYNVVFSVVPSQIVAFSMFLISINIYRYFLLKYHGKRL